MAEFTWSAVPRYGTCLSCGASSNDSGFIDTFAEVSVTSDEGGPAGFVDAIFCASCVEQMGRLVGTATRQEVEELVYKQHTLELECEKLKDEVLAEKQRFDMLVSATGDELRSFLDAKAKADGTTSP